MADFLHMIVAMLLFVAALSICFTGGKTVMNTVANNKLRYQESVLFEVEEKIYSYCVTGEALWAKLMCGSEIDVQIRGMDGSVVTIPAGDRVTEHLDSSSFSFDSEYCLDYEYGNYGGTKLLCFAEVKKDR